MWGQTWGQLIWGQAASVPSLGWWGALLLGVLLGMVAAHTLRGARARAIGAFVLAIAFIVPIAAHALPFTFSNGTIADANQVNANFEAVNITTARIALTSEVVFPTATSSNYVFEGSTSTLTTTATQRITGSATSFVFVTAAGGAIDQSFCYRAAATTNPLITFPGGVVFSTKTVVPDAPVGSTSFETTTVTDTVVPGAGSWEVGKCLNNGTASPLHVNRMSGWLQVTPL
jgi:hypothetical protein